MKKHKKFPFLFGSVCGSELGLILLYFTTGKFQWSFWITYILGSVIGWFIYNRPSKNHDKDS
ncbi:hypothetical protein [Ectobacillus polymachus]|uniref:hypothetical protein n=1 Tax=Ectobacillus polymachus TaxID=1508806 RepID=UPI003A897EFF